MTTGGWREVTKDEFYSSVGQMDVTPYPAGEYPYTAYWKTRGGETVGRSVDYRPAGEGNIKTSYWVRFK